MTGVRGLDHVNLRVPPELLEPVRAFYINLVGLRDGPRPPVLSGSHGYWLYAGTAAVVHLSVGNVDGLKSQGNGFFSHLAFACTDLAATRERLDAAGIIHRMQVLDDGAQVQVFVVDPAGITVELNFRQ
jgi:catechol 2,3-dioxygenase-like lactoylglutathione lyase family enzyme